MVRKKSGDEWMAFEKIYRDYYAKRAPFAVPLWNLTIDDDPIETYQY